MRNPESLPEAALNSRLNALCRQPHRAQPKIQSAHAPQRGEDGAGKAAESGGSGAHPQGLLGASQTMPGILAMNPSGAEGPAASRDGEAKKRTHDGRFVNGERNATARDVAVGAPAVTAPAAMPGANGASLSTSGVPSTLIPAHMAQEPPAIPHLDSSNYFALSKLLARISQECFNDLNQALQKMADVSASYPPNRTLPNGNSVYGVPNGVQENPELSKQKKLILMRFAQDSRAKFIKLLVLTEWGKKSSVDVSKLIDIFSWTRGQSAAMDEVDVKIERLKILSSQARQYNPDIRTALEILANQKAGWIPDVSMFSIQLDAAC